MTISTTTRPIEQPIQALTPQSTKEDKIADIMAANKRKMKPYQAVNRVMVHHHYSRSSAHFRTPQIRFS
ncbi:hypothetical protein BCU68_06555 [Vibrio sp. 10N.286.49.B3]|uniref:hypothetical protein n=1 Tax=Vibrio sp. 10N.286.49.B3 TaxID=1880855 RepID=UPI000C82BF8B|nr:hypothetical protein [Vibrio sp. 10N.286.49.B3]PMH39756.1 hypothetical protein BCU68_06555 [Vibrio sp. 10N.286.49.B3]